MQNKKIQLWALSIAGYNTQVEYIKGKENHCADLLSRIPFKKGEKEELQQSKSTPEDEELDIDDRSLEQSTPTRSTQETLQVAMWTLLETL